MRKKMIRSWFFSAIDNFKTIFSLVKVKDGGSMEDLTSTNVERQTNVIKARLRKFFHRRPTMESLVKKGIWKGILITISCNVLYPILF